MSRNGHGNLENILNQELTSLFGGHSDGLAHLLQHFGHHHATPPVPPTGTAPAFADLGATFNDATRALEGGLWRNAVNEGGQGNGDVPRYVSDLTAVQTGLTAEVAAGQFSGATLAHVHTILADLKTAIAAAPASVEGGGCFGSTVAAQTALHDAHLDILKVVNGDPHLAALATANGGNGFLAAPAALPAGTTAANAPHADLAEIGAIFNDAANKAIGGINSHNAAAIVADDNAAISALQSLMKAQPQAFEGLTGVHAETIVRQLELENKFVQEAATHSNPLAARASNDNLLDIIDIVQGDADLAAMATQHGVSGFTPFGDALNPTPKYVDNAAQTNFWANFIAQSNSLGQQAVQAVDAHDAGAIATLTAELHTFQKDATAFDQSQGGVFEARFDNELLGNTSTLGAEVSKMIEGLQSGNATLVAAAADEMHANAADVAGNNIPVGGGTFNTDGLTMAQALPAPTTATASTTTTPAAAPTPTTAAAATPATASSPTAAAPAQAAHDLPHAADGGTVAFDQHLSHLADVAHHFQHLWG